MREEFGNILSLLDFDRRAYDIFRRWYIDGRLFYHKMINPENPKEGITEPGILILVRLKRLLNTINQKTEYHLLILQYLL